ncbi:MAG: sigma-70 family RNA polymerase sigma factor [Myxococcales bacterium]|nr:sigma-70 family RNA polymerase sigma factor [Myxococcales bacterium]
MSKLTLVSSRPAVERRPSRPSDRDPEREDDVRDLASIYRRHAAEVSRWAQRLGGPGMDPEDIVHDVFLVVQRRLPEWRGDAKLSTWLYEITVRVVQDRRRSVRRRRLLWPFKRGLAQDELLACVPDGGPSIVEDIERRQSTALLYKLLDDLDDKYRTAVILFELEGLSCQEIATVTNASVQNVWVRLSRGREKLAQALLAWTAGEARQ